MRVAGRLGLLGGTFDPFHNGHLAGARAARAALTLDLVHVIPAHVPPHRPVQPHASAEHRFAMVALGIAGDEGILADDRELRRDELSFTSRTLAQFADEGWHASQIFFITGADAFAEIATWRRYPEILDQAHFVVIARAGRSATSLRGEMPALASRMRDLPAEAPKAPPPAAPDIAEPVIWLVDADTPDVSATRIREAVAAGRRITGETPPLVEQHILRHGLYRRTPSISSPAAGPAKAASALHEQEPA